MLSSVTDVYPVFMPARTGALMFVKQSLSGESAGEASEIGNPPFVSLLMSAKCIRVYQTHQTDRSDEDLSRKQRRSRR